VLRHARLCPARGRCWGLAYVADYVAGLRVISVADPANPSEVGYYDAPGDACGVAVAGDYIYVANGDSGLMVYEFYGGGVEEVMSGERQAMRVPATIARGVLFLEEATIREPPATGLLDAAGRKVMELHTGANDVSRLAPGVYFVKVNGALSTVNARKVVIQK
jgi:hypothetical protein